MDAGRGLGTVQEDAGKSHTHTGSASAGGSHVHAASTDVQGSHSHELKKSWGSNNTPGGWVSPANIGNSMASTEPAGAHSHTVTVAPAGEHGHIITIGATGGGETRPWNIAFLACIKY